MAVVSCVCQETRVFCATATCPGTALRMCVYIYIYSTNSYIEREEEGDTEKGREMRV